jgi:hypothetical protein
MSKQAKYFVMVFIWLSFIKLSLTVRFNGTKTIPVLGDGFYCYNSSISSLAIQKGPLPMSSSGHRLRSLGHLL